MPGQAGHLQTSTKTSSKSSPRWCERDSCYTIQPIELCANGSHCNNIAMHRHTSCVMNAGEVRVWNIVLDIPLGAKATSLQGSCKVRNKNVSLSAGGRVNLRTTRIVVRYNQSRTHHLLIISSRTDSRVANFFHKEVKEDDEVKAEHYVPGSFFIQFYIISIILTRTLLRDPYNSLSRFPTIEIILPTSSTPTFFSKLCAPIK